jgi:hypothetical protein
MTQILALERRCELLKSLPASVSSLASAMRRNTEDYVAVDRAGFAGRAMVVIAPCYDMPVHIPNQIRINWPIRWQSGYPSVSS